MALAYVSTLRLFSRDVRVFWQRRRQRIRPGRHSRRAVEPIPAAPGLRHRIRWLDERRERARLHGRLSAGGRDGQPLGHAPGDDRRYGPHGVRQPAHARG